MSNLLSPQDFGLKIYNRFPLKYRGDDAQNNFALKRYLQSAGEGGFKYAIEDINGLTSLVDPNSVKAEFLPVIFQQYGFEPFNGIPEEYLRYLLPKLGDIYSMKGSLQAVEYLCTSLSGIKTITSVTYDSKGDPYIEVRLEMDVSLGDFVPDISSLNRIIRKFIPFYCDFVTIHSYLFWDNINLDVDEYSLTKIKSVKEDNATIVGSTEPYYTPTLNRKETLLNSSFTLNATDNVDEVDSFEDKITSITTDSKSLGTSHCEEGDSCLFLNSTHCTLNNIPLGVPCCYDTITDDTSIRRYYPQSYGLVLLGMDSNIPIATKNTVGVVKVDAESLDIKEDGTLKATKVIKILDTSRELLNNSK